MSRAGPRVPALLLATVSVSLVAAIAACDPTASPSSPATTPTSSAAPTSSRTGGGPLATPWLGNAVNAIEAMGLADAEIGEGMTDFNAGVQAGDPARMLEAARGLKGVDVMLANADRIAEYPPMRDFAERYREAIEQLSSSATDLEEALVDGDAPGVTEASNRLVAAMTLYAGVRQELADWVVQVPEQKRVLVR
jgi:hypothetical protein